MQRNVLEYFEKTVKLYPDRVAVIDLEKKISFQDLAILSQKLALQIIEMAHEEINKPLAVFLPKSLNSVIADLAITYSRNIYMNLDIKSPAIRIKNIIEQINPVAFITNSANINILKEILDDGIVINVDEPDEFLPLNKSIFPVSLDKQIHIV